MKFHIAIMGKDLNSGITAALNFEGKGEWLALWKDNTKKVAGFHMSELLQLSITDEKGNGFYFQSPRHQRKSAP